MAGAPGKVDAASCLPSPDRSHQDVEWQRGQPLRDARETAQYPLGRQVGAQQHAFDAFGHPLEGCAIDTADDRDEPGSACGAQREHLVEPNGPDVEHHDIDVLLASGLTQRVALGNDVVVVRAQQRREPGAEDRIRLDYPDTTLGTRAVAVQQRGPRRRAASCVDADLEETSFGIARSHPSSRTSTLFHVPLQRSAREANVDDRPANREASDGLDLTAHASDTARNR